MKKSRTWMSGIDHSIPWVVLCCCSWMCMGWVMWGVGFSAVRGREFGMVLENRVAMMML
jgi:hypothetical protein